MKFWGHNGFSLTETMVSMALFTVITSGIYSTLYVGNVSWGIQDANVNVQSQVRKTVDKMTRDLRVAQGLLIAQDADNVNVSFTKTGEGTVTYTWTTDAGNSQYQLVRTTNANSHVVAQDISALSVTQTASDIKINVTSSVQALQGHTVDYALVSNVAKR